MEQNKPAPEIHPPHTPEIKPVPQQPAPVMPNQPEIAPGKKDPQPSKGPAEVPPKKL